MTASPIGTYSLPRVSAETRERLSKEFDDYGPVMRAGRTLDLIQRENPELLEMATRWARDIGDSERMMQGFAMFYGLLRDAAGRRVEGGARDVLPRVSGETRDALVRLIDTRGSEAFVMEAVDHLERYNPELLQATHRVASQHPDYLAVIQGFALFYMALLVQLRGDVPQLH
jgi:hypothetical protein